MFELVRSIRRHQRLLRDFVVRDLKGRYVGSSMGFFWSIVFPLISLATYTFVFRLVLNMRWGNQQPGEQVVVMMFLGIVVWSAFSETISRSTNTLVENSNLIQKVVFPSEVLPLYLAVSSWVNMCIGLVFVFAATWWWGYVSPAQPVEIALQPGESPFAPFTFGAPLLLLPLLFVLQLVFALGLGYMLAALNLFVRDVFHLIGVALTVWMFSTPIFYPAELVRTKGFGWILDLNPMAWLIDSYRDVILFARWPDLAALSRFAFIAALLFALGAAFFQKSKPRFPDLL